MGGFGGGVGQTMCFYFIFTVFTTVGFGEYTFTTTYSLAQ